jgi:hypothetical protein
MTPFPFLCSFSSSDFKPNLAADEMLINGRNVRVNRLIAFQFVAETTN